MEKPDGRESEDLAKIVIKLYSELSGGRRTTRKHPA
jgi:hypothetical protein